ncbi:MAG: hypothetical protein AAF226_18495, partial [Verrucomicrobiota bacterium]
MKHTPKTSRGWTLVELLVAATLGAFVLSTSLIVFQNIGTNSRRMTTQTEVSLGVHTVQNYYSESKDLIKCYTAPSYGLMVQAHSMIDFLKTDLGTASAVYILPRSNINTIRPTHLPITGLTDGLSEAEDFRQLLHDVYPLAIPLFDTEATNYTASGDQRY